MLWTAEAAEPLYCIAVCSDSKASQTEAEDLKVGDLAFPATTDTAVLVKRFEQLHSLTQKSSQSVIVVFSTYQSIDVIAQAQQQGLSAFDVIICDEAHRTTGMTLAGNEESHFVKVHDADFIKANKSCG